MSNSIIRAELTTRLRAWADAQVPKVPIAFENAAFTKPLTGSFLQPVLVPNITIDADLAGTHQRLVGIFEIACWSPSGKGIVTVESLSASVIALFPLLPTVGTVHIQSTPYAGQAQPEPSGWIVVPVTVMYRYETI